MLVVHDKRFVSDTPCSNLAIKYNMMYLCAHQIIREEVRGETEIGKKLRATKKPKSVNMYGIENDEFEENEYSATHYDYNLVLDLISA